MNTISYETQMLSPKSINPLLRLDEPLIENNTHTFLEDNLYHC